MGSKVTLVSLDISMLICRCVVRVRKHFLVARTHVRIVCGLNSFVYKYVFIVFDYSWVLYNNGNIEMANGFTERMMQRVIFTQANAF